MESTEQNVHTCNPAEGYCAGKCCWKKNMGYGMLLLAVSGSLFLIALFAAELKAYQFIGRDVPGEQTSISVTGDGEAFAFPDIAEISFSVTNEAKTAPEARKLVDDKMVVIKAFLKESGIDDKDMKTTAYNLNPKYEWQKTGTYMPCALGYNCPPPEGKQVLIGYEVTQSVDVRVRKINDAGLVLGGISDKGASYVSGLTFTVDNEDKVKETARNEAIAKAKAKAKDLAAQLGVSIVRITSFNEGMNYPMYNYGRGGMELKAMSADMATTPATIPAGENKYTSNVTITYEVR